MQKISFLCTFLRSNMPDALGMCITCSIRYVVPAGIEPTSRV